MSERETKIVETPVGKTKVELKTWLTGREKRAISQVFLAGTEFKGDAQATSFKGELIDKAQDVTILNVVVSVDGIKENVLDKVLDMRAEDFDFVVNEINKVTNPKTEEELKK